MSGGPTFDGIQYLLDLIRNADQAASIYYVALIQQIPPGFTIGSEELDEPDFPEYTRATIENVEGNWDVSDNTLSNIAEVTFTTALSDWGQINYWAVCDQSQGLGGRVIWVGQLDAPLFVESGDQPYLPPGALSLPVSGNQWAFG